MESGSRNVRWPEDGIRFVTRAATRGPLAQRISPVHEDMELASGEFGVLNLTPDGDNFPLTDLASLRMHFSEPLDPQTVVYGDSIRLENERGEPVPAELLVKGPNLTLDPDENLQPGKRYTLSLSDAIRSTLNAQLNPGRYQSFEFTPRDAHASDPLPLKIVTDNNGSRLSGLSGDPFNSVLLGSALLGPLNQTFIGRPDNGELADHVFFNLGSVVRYPDTTPLKISRGTTMKGTGLDVFVAGVQDANLPSGDITVTFLSDANGFMVPNPYSDSSRAPKNLLMFVDLALNTGDTRANSALSQELLNVPLVGTVAIEDGALTIDVLTMIEPDVMGIDAASGLVSFRLEGYKRAADGPSMADFRNNAAPFIKSWVPGEDSDRMRPGDPLILYFNEPVKRSSVAGAIELYESGSPVATKTQVDGGVVIVTPEQPLHHGVDYSLNVEGIKNLAGTAMVPVNNKTFSLVPTATHTSDTQDPEELEKRQAPLVLTTLPGYPCAKELAQDKPNELFDTQGQCAGGKTSDDHLPIQKHPGDRPVIVRFSQNMDPESFQAGKTVRLYKQNGSEWEEMNDWILEVDAREIRLQPVSAWESDTLYKYTLASYDPDCPSSSDCNDEFIFSESGLPLQTQFLSHETRMPFERRDFGGPDLVNHFRGASPSSKTLAPLRNLPSADANADLRLNEEETGVQPEDATAMANSSGLRVAGVEPLNQESIIKNAALNCSVGDPNCDPLSFIYITAMLDVDIGDSASEANCLNLVGNAPSGDPACVPVKLFPSVLYTTDLNVVAQIDTALIDSFPDFVLSVDVSENETVPTGPMLMRMRQQEGNKNGVIDGAIQSETITVNGSTQTQLFFETELDVYLDAPYLNPSIGPANLSHNLFSYELDNIRLRGPISFLPDGRMEISLQNLDALQIDVELEGSITLSGNSGGICSIWGISFICDGIANAILDLDTQITLEIPEGELFVNYISPYTRD